jgi:predicted ATPase
MITPMSPNIRRVVITGGPYSGKTTLIEALAMRGHGIVGEAAIQVIAELGVELGNEGQALWRRENPEAFQVLIIEKQAQLEEVAAAATKTPFVFLDRGRLDGVAYCHVYERPVPDEVEMGCRNLPYDMVFLLDTLQDFEGRSESGRTSDRTRSLVIRDHLRAVYEQRGFVVFFVNEMPVERRVQFVLDKLG